MGASCASPDFLRRWTMDPGELFKKSFQVRPTECGSFVILIDSIACEGMPKRIVGFSNIFDLMHFLRSHADQFDIKEANSAEKF